MAEFEELKRLPFIIDQLEAIQELHPKEYASSGDEAYELNPRCGNCGTAFPCATRRLADDALTARTTKNGEKP